MPLRNLHLQRDEPCSRATLPGALNFMCGNGHIEPLPLTSRDSKYVLVIGVIKCVKVYPRPNMEAGTVAELLVSGLICHFAVRQMFFKLIRDKYSALLKELYQLLRVDKTRTTTPFNLQSDYFVE